MTRIKYLALQVLFLFLFSCSSDNGGSPGPATNGSVLDVSELVPGISDFTVSDFNLPPQNQDGFTQLTPSENSQFVYVHASQGNDETGQVYQAGDAAIGSDPMQPAGPVAAFASIAAAFGQLRAGEPDWMLLAAGEHWEESLDLNRGASANERSVVTAYGDGERPELRTGMGMGIRSGQPRFVVVSGIRFWAHTRDDEGPYFSSFDGGNESKSFRIFTFAAEAAKIQDVLIEDCVFRSYVTAEILGSTAPAFPMERVAFRRNIFSRNYSTLGSHSQGIYHDGSEDNGMPVLLLEENTFDHNGWRIQSVAGMNDPTDGQATGFNHNIYFSSAKNVVVQGNFFLRGASAGNKWRSDEEGKSHHVLIKDNLYFDNEVALSIGGNFSDSYRFQRFEVVDNVITDMGLSRPTNRELGWGIDFNDHLNSLVKNNIITRQENPDVTTVYAMAIYSTQGSESKALNISNNIVYNIQANAATTPNWGGGIVRVGAVSNVLVADNQFYFNLANSGALLTYYSSDAVEFASNQYFSNRATDEWFAYDDSFVGFNTWQSEVEENAAELDGSQWPDPDRNIDSYISSLGLGSTNQDFIDALYGQSRSNWNGQLRAPVVNDWIRAGFGK